MLKPKYIFLIFILTALIVCYVFDLSEKRETEIDEPQEQIENTEDEPKEQPIEDNRAEEKDIPVEKIIKISTDKRKYSLSETVEITISNNLSRTIWYSSPWYLERFDKDKWTRCFPKTYIEHLSLEPGEEIKGALDLTSPDICSKALMIGEYYRVCFDYFFQAQESKIQGVCYSFKIIEENSS